MCDVDRGRGQGTLAGYPEACEPARVLLLTQYFPPETGAPQARLFNLARSLRELGWEVEVLTTMPSYPKGRIYPGYRRRLVMREEVDGLPVVRVAVYPTTSPATLPRLANYFSFVLSAATLGLGRVGRPDVILLESPPLFLGITAMALKTIFRCNLVMNVSDLWPDSAVHMGLYQEGTAVRLARRLERACYRSADMLTGQSPGIVRALLERHPHGRAALLPNGCDGGTFNPDVADHDFLARHGLEGLVVVGYAGLLGVAQGVGLLLDAARLLRDEPVGFIIVGDGPERAAIERQVNELQLSHFVFAGHLPRSHMAGLVSAFDIAFVPLRYLIPGALPSKVYEAMACGVPILLAADGDARELVSRARAGISVRYDAQAMASALGGLVADPAERRRLGQNGRDYVLAHHQPTQIASKADRILRAVLNGDAATLDRESGADWE